MSKAGTAAQIAIVIGAIAFGMLLGRLIFGPGNEASNSERVAASNNAAAAGANLPAESSSRAASPGDRVSRPDAGASAASPNTAGSLDAILAQDDPRQRLRDLQAFIDSVPAAGFADALRRIRQITSSNERLLASRLLVAQWVQTDPDGALQFAAGNAGFEYLAEDVFQSFAAKNFDAAIQRAEAMPGTELRYRALRGIVTFKADTDPQGAIKLAYSLGEFRGNEPLASVVYRQWAATDPKSAALAASQQGQGDGWRSPLVPVVQTWAEQDPVAAANWSITLDNTQAQANSLAQVMRQWTREDPNAAANWIHSLDPGTSRDAAVAGLAQSLVTRDPQTALSWIGTITDDAARNRTLQRISGVVMWRDPQNGAALLQAAGLPPEQIRYNRRRPEQ